MKIPGFDGNPVLVVSAGGFHSAVVTVQGTQVVHLTGSNSCQHVAVAGVFSFGGNQFGQLGEGTGSDCLDSFSPQRVTSLDKFGCKFVDVQCGGTHTAALSGKRLHSHPCMRCHVRICAVVVQRRGKWCVGDEVTAGSWVLALAGGTKLAGNVCRECLEHQLR